MDDLIQNAIDKLWGLKNAPITNVEISVNKYGDDEINLSINVNYKEGELIRIKDGEVFIPKE